MQEYPFPDDPEADGYRVFPDALESDPNVAFHGTTAEILQLIVRSGFKIAGKLPSNSFAKNSGLALSYACEKRTKDSQGCVIAVRFADLTAKGLSVEPSVIYLYEDEGGPQPTILGYCVVPEDYQHV